MPAGEYVQVNVAVANEAEAAAIREAFRMNMWGVNGDQTFQEACRAEDLRMARPYKGERTITQDHTVSPAERRAVALLAQLCDSDRVRRYLATGLLYARGNVTGTVFCLCRISPKVIELDQRGKIAATWCIHANRQGWNPSFYDQSPGRVPITDEVVTFKNLIEGEEAKFRLTGNRTRYRPEPEVTPYPNLGFGPGFGGDYAKKALTPGYKNRGVSDPHRIDFMGGMQPQIDPKIVAEAKAKYAARQQKNMADYQAAGQMPHPMGMDEHEYPLPPWADDDHYFGGGVGGRSATKLDAEAAMQCDPRVRFKEMREALKDERWEKMVMKSREKIEVSIL